MDTYYKYKKYKSKYIKLNNLLENYKKDYTSYTYCDKKGFEQHQGECWNDTIQTFFCFSDECKIQVQRKLWNLTAEEIVEFAFIMGRDKYLPYVYKTRINDLKLKLIEYIRILQERLCHYIQIDPSIKVKPKKCNVLDVCHLKDPNKVLSNSLRLGVEGAIVGLEITRNKEIPHDLKDENHGGLYYDEVILYTLLSIILLDNQNIIIAKGKPIDELMKENLDEVIFIKVISNYSSINSNQVNHVTGFLKCNGKLLFYDNNHGFIDFDWKKYLFVYLQNLDYIPVINMSIFMQPFFKNQKNNKYYSLDNQEIIIKNSNNLQVFTHLTLFKKIKISNEIDYINKSRESLLQIEIANKTFINIKKYIENGLDINETYLDDKSNIVQYLLYNNCNEIKLFEYLINEIKVPINYVNAYDYNALYFCENQTIFEFLFNKGCDINKISKVTGNSILFNRTDLNLVKFICGKINKDIISIKNFNGNTILHILAIYDYFDIFFYLVNTYKLYINTLNNDNETPIHFAIKHNSKRIFNNFINKDLLKLKNKKGNLLHYAVEYRNFDAIKKLDELNLLDSLNYMNNDNKLPRQLLLIDGTKIKSTDNEMYQYLIKKNKN